ncbi:hypothetical protein N7466_007201 [Penicillium verhagenii]|uniref:uncharacterized protein n=1 Tax=Penicillium verhagenii TaxID=1562060 RepID=UPI002544E617|nr:uncharacterized protein N7466_007201 [Penicillium verhagenii]KAJ5928245.1 hypothetical protein N7466_007201 [Penicillium verhagenii]
MTSYKAIIFDMGDVLFQWKPQMKTKISVDILKAIVQSDLWYDYERGQMSAAECYQQLSETYGVSQEEIASTFHQSTSCLTPNPIMAELLHELKSRGFAIYMMTNIPQLDFDQLRSMEYDWHLFDRIFASGYLGMRKPDRCFYEHVVKEIGVTGAEAIFVDDKKENVVAAQDVGMTGFLFKGAEASQFCGELKVLLAGVPAEISE